MTTLSTHARATADPTALLAPFARTWACLLTSRRRDGTPVATPVNIAVDGDRAYVRTYDLAFKTGRMVRDPIVEIAPSTARGRVTGPAIRARARLLEDAEAAHASRLIQRKHPVFQGVVVPFGHRMRGYRTLHFELVPTDA